MKSTGVLSGKRGGKCKSGEHKMVWKKDGDSRSFFSCEICGIVPVNMEKRNGK